MDPANTTVYNATSWDLSESTKSTGVAFTMRTGTADLLANAVTLKETMDGVGGNSGTMPADGIIPAGVTDARFLIRFLIPADEDTVGIRQIDQVLKYAFTS